MARAFVALDGLRGIAALAVIGLHLGGLFGPLSFPGGYLAVDLFFVLSGFVLAHAYDERLRTQMTARAFLLARAIRLYPLYLLGFCVFFGLQVLTHLTGPWEPWSVPPGPGLMLSVLGLPTPPALSNSPTLYPINYPAWSLFFELVINVLYAFSARHLTTRRLIALVALGAVGVIWTAVAQGDLDVGADWKTMVGGIARVAFSFPAGLLLYRLWLNGPSVKLPLWLGVAALVAVFAIPASGGGRLAWDLTAALVIFPALVYGMAATGTGRLTGACSALGAASFAVYVLHIPIWSIVSRFWPRFFDVKPDELSPLFGFGFVAIVFGIGLLAHRFYDQPVRRWLTNRAAPPPRLPVTP